MNIAIISGTVKEIHYRGSAERKTLYTDVVLSVVDDIRPDEERDLYFTATGNSSRWRDIEVGDFIEVRGKLNPGLGFTKHGNVAHEMTFMPQGVRKRG